MSEPGKWVENEFMPSGTIKSVKFVYETSQFAYQINPGFRLI